MNSIRPIVSSLFRHKSAVVIIVIEVALTCAILCNAIDLITRKINGIRSTTGIEETRLLRIMNLPLVSEGMAMSRTKEDLAVIRAVPGVENVSLINQMPLTDSSSNSSFSTDPDGKNKATNAAQYIGNDEMIDTLGVKLVAGRKFNADDFETFETEVQANSLKFPSVIVTHALAEAMFPGQNAIGKSIYSGSPNPSKIIGVVDKLVRPSSSGGDSQSKQFSVLMAVRGPITMFGAYLIRAREGADTHTVLKAVSDALNKAYPRRVTTRTETISDMRVDYYAQDRSMAWMLAVVTLTLLLVTALGIVGLASFWVQQRTKQIGVRRALGASRSDILRYFQTENFLIVTVGITLGMILAFAVNQLLMKHYEMPRLSWVYLPVGAVVLWILGQIAVFAPALRAASIPPATATRSV